MKKLLLIIMPITIIFALIFAIRIELGKEPTTELSFMSLLNGFNKLEFTDFPLNKLNEALNQIKFEETWQGIWDNVNNISDWFAAIGLSFKAVGESIVQIGLLLWGIVQFGLEFVKWFWENLIVIIQFLGYYLGI